MDKKISELVEKSAKYDQLAASFKYTDPNQHIFYYLKHLKNMNKALQLLHMQSLESKGNLRFIHGWPDNSKIDLYLNDKKYLTDFSYKDISEYIELLPGSYQIDIFTSEENSKKKASEKIIIQAGFSYTSVMVNKHTLFSYLNDSKVPQGESKIRFLHLSSDAPIVDIAVKNRDVVFPCLSYFHTTEFLGLTPMTIDLEIREVGSKSVICPIPKAHFRANEAYTILLVGIQKEKVEAIPIKE